jgi:hypothetical protein
VLKNKKANWNNDFSQVVVPPRKAKPPQTLKAKTKPKILNYS